MSPPSLSTVHRSAPPRPVSAQRLAAVCMVICEAAVIAQPSRGWFFSFGLMSLALLSILLASRRRLPDMPMFWQVVGVTSAFAFKYSLLPHVFPVDASYINSELSHEIANGLIAVQLCVLFQARYEERIPSTFIVLGGIAVVFGCNARVHGIQRDVALLLGALFLLSIGLVAMTSRQRVAGSRPGGRWRQAILGTVILVFAVTAFTSAHLLRKYERDLESLVLNYLAGADGEGSARAGFSGSGTLSQIGEWKKRDENRIRLRVTSNTSPGYLRGRAWDFYSSVAGRWSTSVDSNPVGIGAPLGAERPAFSGNFFRIGDASSTEWRSMEVRVDESHYPAVFVPLETAFVYLDSNSLTVDEHSTIYLRGSVRTPYAAFLPVEHPRQMLSERVRVATLHLDAGTDPRIRAIAEELFRDRTTARSRMNAVVEYLTRNFQYKLGIEIPANEDPLAYFLSRRVPAHCEYFASAAAILLKLGGVPARYVTGYVAAERNELGGVWIARSRDAHAWVEAYDDADERWHVVEATPSSGVPSFRASAPSEEFVGGIWQAILELKEIFLQKGPLAVIRHLAMQPALQVVTIGALLIWWLQRRSQSRAHFLPSGTPATRDLREWHGLLERMDAAMWRVGLPRGTDETLLDFAERLRRSVDTEHRDTLAGWYRTYAEARYSSELAEPPPGLKVLPDLRRISLVQEPHPAPPP